MDAQQFAYWLQGFAELNEAPPTAEQWKSIQEHLATVFVKVTPDYKPNQTIPLIKPVEWPRQTSAKDLPFYHELMRSECLAADNGAIATC